MICFAAITPPLRRALSCSLAACLLLSLPALAETHTTAKFGAGQIDTPAEPKAIPLRPPVKDAAPEQWSMRSADARDVRNVVNPTLTPVLPDPAKATGAAVIIAPGGGFFMLAIDNEGYKVAKWLADRGIAAFVLKYRLHITPRDEAGFLKTLQETRERAANTNRALDALPEAVEDAQAAVRLVRSRAKEWNIDPQRVGFVGFSAGGVTALAVGLNGDAASRPDFIAPIYPPMTAREVPGYAPPMFLAIALDDPLFATSKSGFGLIDAWRNSGRPFEVHLYERGGHGFGMKGVSAATALWIDEFHAWMIDREIAVKKSANDKITYSVSKSTIGKLFDNPKTRAILDKHVPEISKSEKVQRMREQTLLDIQAYARAIVTEEKLRAIQADLEELNR